MASRYDFYDYSDFDPENDPADYEDGPPELASLPDQDETEARDRRRDTAYERFIEQVDLNPDPVNGCLEWRGRVDEHGYGVIKVGRKTERVHRFAYRIAMIDDGELPKGAVITPCCYTKTCVRLDHLSMVKP